MIAPNALTTAWDKIYLFGVPSPGVVTLSGHKRPIGWDIKKASGQDGATNTRKGEPLGRFTASFHLVDDPYLGSDFDQWPTFEKLIRSSVSSSVPVALPVYHPELERNGFTAVVLEEMGEMKPDGKGGANIAVKFIEYRPPKPKPPASTQKPEAESEADRRIQEAEAELDALLEEGENL